MGCGTDQAFTAFVGIDWADTEHDICVQATGVKRREFTCIAHEPGIIESWVCSLRERFGDPIAVALELTKGPIVSYWIPLRRSPTTDLGQINRSQKLLNAVIPANLFSLGTPCSVDRLQALER